MDVKQVIVTQLLLSNGTSFIITCYGDTATDEQWHFIYHYLLWWHSYWWTIALHLSLLVMVTQLLMSNSTSFIITCDGDTASVEQWHFIYHYLWWWHSYWWAMALHLSLLVMVTQLLMSNSTSFIITCDGDTATDEQWHFIYHYLLWWHSFCWAMTLHLSLLVMVTQLLMSNGTSFIITCYGDTASVEQWHFIYHYLWWWHSFCWAMALHLSLLVMVTQLLLSNGTSFIITCDGDTASVEQWHFIYHYLWWWHSFCWAMALHLSLLVMVTQLLLSNGTSFIITCDGDTASVEQWHFIYHYLWWWHSYWWAMALHLSLLVMVTQLLMSNGTSFIITCDGDTATDEQWHFIYHYLLWWHSFCWAMALHLSLLVMVTQLLMSNGTSFIITCDGDTAFDEQWYFIYHYLLWWHSFCWAMALHLSLLVMVTQLLLSNGTSFIITCDGDTASVEQWHFIYHYLWWWHSCWAMALHLSLLVMVTQLLLSNGTSFIITCDGDTASVEQWHFIYHYLWWWHSFCWAMALHLSLLVMVTQLLLSNGTSFIITCDGDTASVEQWHFIYHYLLWWHSFCWAMALHLSLLVMVTQLLLSNGTSFIITCDGDTASVEQWHFIYHYLWWWHSFCWAMALHLSLLVMVTQLLLSNGTSLSLLVMVTQLLMSNITSFIITCLKGQYIEARGGMSWCYQKSLKDCFFSLLPLKTLWS